MLSLMATPMFALQSKLHPQKVLENEDNIDDCVAITFTNTPKFDNYICIFISSRSSVVGEPIVQQQSQSYSYSYQQQEVFSTIDNHIKK